jgi:hypothetical protein
VSDRLNREYADSPRGGRGHLHAVPCDSNGPRRQTSTESAAAAAACADRISAVAAMSKEERQTSIDNAFERMASAKGVIGLALGEVDRSQE